MGPDPPAPIQPGTGSGVPGLGFGPERRPFLIVPVRTKTIVVAVGSQCAAIGGDILDYAGCRASTGSPRTEAPALPARFCTGSPTRA